MMFGNVAPAPLSCTCAAAGAAAKTSATRAMERVVFTGSSSVGVALERELRLEQGSGPDRLSRRRRRPALIRQIVDVEQQAQIRAHLIRDPCDNAGLVVTGDGVVGIQQVDPGDGGELGRLEGV